MAERRAFRRPIGRGAQSYVPRNPVGASLPVRAPSIGFISDTVGTEPFAGELIRGCVTAATERGHSLLMTETEGWTARARRRA